MPLSYNSQWSHGHRPATGMYEVVTGRAAFLRRPVLQVVRNGTRASSVRRISRCLRMVRTAVTTTKLPQTGTTPVVRRFPWGGLSVLSVSVFLSVTAEMIPTGLLPEMSSSLQVSESQTGLLISFFAFAVVLTS